MRPGFAPLTATPNLFIVLSALTLKVNSRPNFSPEKGTNAAEYAKMNNRLVAIRHLALDLDGTIYRGDTLFEATEPFLALLKELGIGYTFLTNNPSKSVTDYLAHLREIGIAATEDQLYTSTQATIEYLCEEWPQIKALFVLGTPSMCAEFSAAGFALLPDSAEAEPDAVVVGFDTTLTYSRLCRAAWWISL